MTPQQHRKLIARAKAEAALPSDPWSATALAQPCAVHIKGACLRYNVSLLRDERYSTMPIPVCFRCRCYLEQLWADDPDSDEAAFRFERAALRTWERGAAIGAVQVTGQITGARPANGYQPQPRGRSHGRESHPEEEGRQAGAEEEGTEEGRAQALTAVSRAWPA